MWKRLIVFMFLLGSYSASVLAEDGSLRTCQSIKDRIDYVQKLRRKGGTAREMENWKKARKEYKKAFRKLNCSKWASDFK